MVHFPDKICDDRKAIIGTGVFAIAVYVIGIFVAYTWLTYQAPQRYNSSDFRRSTAFLFGRWNPSSWYFGLIYMFRNCFIAFISVLYPTDGAMQVSWTLVAMALYIVVVGQRMPWKITIVSVCDILMAFGVVIMLAFMLGIGVIAVDTETIQKRIDTHAALTIFPLVISCGMPFVALLVSAATPDHIFGRKELGIVRGLRELSAVVGELSDEELQNRVSIYLAPREREQLCNATSVTLAECFQKTVSDVYMRPRLMLGNPDPQSQNKVVEV